jgi:hypothetical protein
VTQLLRAKARGAASTRSNRLLAEPQASRSNCARCHSVDPNDKSRSLAGKVFWQSFRESTVDRLLDYVSRNMRNGGVAHWKRVPTRSWWRLFLAGTIFLWAPTELTKESATGAQLIAKDGPGELPHSGPCHRLSRSQKKVAGGYSTPRRLRNARNRNREPMMLSPLGTSSYPLTFLITPLDPCAGHRSRVRGLLMGEVAATGIKASTTESLSKTCQWKTAAELLRVLRVL